MAVERINVYGHSDCLLWVSLLYNWRSNQIEIEGVEDGSVGHPNPVDGWPEMYFDDWYNLSEDPIAFMSWMIHEGIAPRQVFLIRLYRPSLTTHNSPDYGLDYDIDYDMEVVRVMPLPEGISGTRISRVLRLIQAKGRSHKSSCPTVSWTTG